MQLSAIHFLLTYQCTHECDHCFVWGSPRAGGTMTLDLVTRVLDQAKEIGTIEEVCFEGGEPFVFYPVMLEGVRRAAQRGFATAAVTNCYWATTADDAEVWLRPLKDLELGSLSLSSDAFHAGDDDDPRPGHALRAAHTLDLDEMVITIDPPKVCPTPSVKGEPLVGGSVRFRGRAVATLTEGLPRRPWTDFTECPDEDFINPQRVHVDGFGNVHLCQGVLLGNVIDRDLVEIVTRYDPAKHPIVGPLVAGGPAELVRRYRLPHDDGYVDACHLCYSARSALRERFPELLAPPQVYGEE